MQNIPIIQRTTKNTMKNILCLDAPYITSEKLSAVDAKTKQAINASRMFPKLEILVSTFNLVRNRTTPNIANMNITESHSKITSYACQNEFSTKLLNDRIGYLKN